MVAAVTAGCVAARTDGKACTGAGRGMGAGAGVGVAIGLALGIVATLGAGAGIDRGRSSTERTTGAACDVAPGVRARSKPGADDDARRGGEAATCTVPADAPCCGKGAASIRVGEGAVGTARATAGAGIDATGAGAEPPVAKPPGADTAGGVAAATCTVSRPVRRRLS